MCMGGDFGVWVGFMRAKLAEKGEIAVLAGGWLVGNVER